MVAEALGPLSDDGAEYWASVKTRTAISSLSSLKVLGGNAPFFQLRLIAAALRSELRITLPLAMYAGRRSCGRANRGGRAGPPSTPCSGHRH